VPQKEAQRAVKMAGSRLRSGKMPMPVPVAAWLLRRLEQMDKNVRSQLPARMDHPARHRN
jgi:hypothetical protein